MSVHARVPLDSLLGKVSTRVAELRLQTARSARHTFDTIETAYHQGFTGEGFVEDIGLSVRFSRGEAETFYAPPIAAWREAALRSQGPARQALFRRIAQSFPRGSRVLNVGAGGDIAPIDAIRAAGHELVCTDAAKSMTDALQAKAKVPCFNADLATLESILESASFDIVFGNSTLGYIAPTKLTRVLQQISRVMSLGGFFSFDLAPLPDYLQAAEPGHARKIANDLDPDRATLAALIRQHGKRQGVNALALQTYLRARSLQLGMLLVLQKQFSGLGLNVELFSTTLSFGARQDVYVLQAFRAERSPFLAVSDLTPLDFDATWAAIAAEKDVHFAMKAIARPQGKEICDLLGVRYRDEREAGWRAAFEATRIADTQSLKGSIREKIARDYSPRLIAERLHQWIASGAPTRPLELPRSWITDQTLRKRGIDAIIAGADQNAVILETDRLIDSAYESAGVAK